MNDLDLEAAIPPVTLDPRWARDCLCDPRHHDLGAFDPGCPRHDNTV